MRADDDPSQQQSDHNREMRSASQGRNPYNDRHRNGKFRQQRQRYRVLAQKLQGLHHVSTTYPQTTRAPESPPYFTDLHLRKRTSQAAGMLAEAAPTYGTRYDAGGDATATSL
jgi:hypothetical protein